MSLLQNGFINSDNQSWKIDSDTVTNKHGENTGSCLQHGIPVTYHDSCRPSDSCNTNKEASKNGRDIVGTIPSDDLSKFIVLEELKHEVRNDNNNGSVKENNFDRNIWNRAFWTRDKTLNSSNNNQTETVTVVKALPTYISPDCCEAADLQGDCANKFDLKSTGCDSEKKFYQMPSSHQELETGKTVDKTPNSEINKHNTVKNELLPNNFIITEETSGKFAHDLANYHNNEANSCESQEFADIETAKQLISNQRDTILRLRREKTPLKNARKTRSFWTIGTNKANRKENMQQTLRSFRTDRSIVRDVQQQEKKIPYCNESSTKDRHFKTRTAKKTKKVVKFRSQLGSFEDLFSDPVLVHARKESRVRHSTSVPLELNEKHFNRSISSPPVFDCRTDTSDENLKAFGTMANDLSSVRNENTDHSTAAYGCIQTLDKVPKRHLKHAASQKQYSKMSLEELLRYCCNKHYRLKFPYWEHSSYKCLGFLSKKYGSIRYLFCKNPVVSLGRIHLPKKQSHSSFETSVKRSLSDTVEPMNKTEMSFKSDFENTSLVDPRVMSMSKALHCSSNGKVGLEKTFKNIRCSSIKSMSGKDVKNKLNSKKAQQQVSGKPKLKPSWYRLKESLKSESKKRQKSECSKTDKENMKVNPIFANHFSPKGIPQFKIPLKTNTSHKDPINYCSVESDSKYVVEASMSTAVNNQSTDGLNEIEVKSEELTVEEFETDSFVSYTINGYSIEIQRSPSLENSTDSTISNVTVMVDEDEINKIMDDEKQLVDQNSEVSETAAPQSSLTVASEVIPNLFVNEEEFVREGDLSDINDSSPPLLDRMYSSDSDDESSVEECKSNQKIMAGMDSDENDSESSLDVGGIDDEVSISAAEDDDNKCDEVFETLDGSDTVFRSTGEETLIKNSEVNRDENSETSNEAQTAEDKEINECLAVGCSEQQNSRCEREIETKDCLELNCTVENTLEATGFQQEPGNVNSQVDEALNFLIVNVCSLSEDSQCQLNEEHIGKDVHHSHKPERELPNSHQPEVDEVESSFETNKATRGRRIESETICSKSNVETEYFNKIARDNQTSCTAVQVTLNTQCSTMSGGGNEGGLALEDDMCSKKSESVNMNESVASSRLPKDKAEHDMDLLESTLTPGPTEVVTYSTEAMVVDNYKNTDHVTNLERNSETVYVSFNTQDNLQRTKTKANKNEVSLAGLNNVSKVEELTTQTGFNGNVRESIAGLDTPEVDCDLKQKTIKEHVEAGRRVDCLTAPEVTCQKKTQRRSKEEGRQRDPHARSKVNVSGEPIRKMDLNEERLMRDFPKHNWLFNKYNCVKLDSKEEVSPEKEKDQLDNRKYKKERKKSTKFLTEPKIRRKSSTSKTEKRVTQNVGGSTETHNKGDNKEKKMILSHESKTADEIEKKMEKQVGNYDLHNLERINGPSMLKNEPRYFSSVNLEQKNSIDLSEVDPKSGKEFGTGTVESGRMTADEEYKYSSRNIKIYWNKTMKPRHSGSLNVLLDDFDQENPFIQNIETETAVASIHRSHSISEQKLMTQHSDLELSASAESSSIITDMDISKTKNESNWQKNFANFVRDSNCRNSEPLKKIGQEQTDKVQQEGVMVKDLDKKELEIPSDPCDRYEVVKCDRQEVINCDRQEVMEDVDDFNDDEPNLEIDEDVKLKIDEGDGPEDESKDCFDNKLSRQSTEQTISTPDRSIVTETSVSLKTTTSFTTEASSTIGSSPPATSLATIGSSATATSFATEVSLTTGASSATVTALVVSAPVAAEPTLATTTSVKADTVPIETVTDTQPLDLCVIKTESSSINFKPRSKPLVQLVYPHVYKPRTEATTTEPQFTATDSSTAVSSSIQATTGIVTQNKHTLQLIPGLVPRQSTCSRPSPAASRPLLIQLNSQTPSTSSLPVVSSFGTGLVIPVQPFVHSVPGSSQPVSALQLQPANQQSCTQSQISNQISLVCALPTLVCTAPKRTEVYIQPKPANYSVNAADVNQDQTRPKMPVCKPLSTRPPPLLIRPKPPGLSDSSVMQETSIAQSIKPFQNSPVSNNTSLVCNTVTVISNGNDGNISRPESYSLTNVQQNAADDSQQVTRSPTNTQDTSQDLNEDADEEVKRQMEELDREIRRKEQEQEEMRRKKLELIQKMRSKAVNKQTVEELSNGIKSTGTCAMDKTKVVRHDISQSVKTVGHCVSRTESSFDNNTLQVSETALGNSSQQARTVDNCALEREKYSDDSNALQNTTDSCNAKTANTHLNVDKKKGVVAQHIETERAVCEKDALKVLSKTDFADLDGPLDLTSIRPGLSDLTSKSTVFTVSDGVISIKEKDFDEIKKDVDSNKLDLLEQFDKCESKDSEDSVDNSKLDSMSDVHYIEDIGHVNPFTGEYEINEEIEKERIEYLDLSTKKKNIENENVKKAERPKESEKLEVDNGNSVTDESCKSVLVRENKGINTKKETVQDRLNVSRDVTDVENTVELKTTTSIYPLTAVTSSAVPQGISSGSFRDSLVSPNNVPSLTVSVIATASKSVISSSLQPHTSDKNIHIPLNSLHDNETTKNFTRSDTSSQKISETTGTGDITEPLDLKRKQADTDESRKADTLSLNHLDSTTVMSKSASFESNGTQVSSEETQEMPYVPKKLRRLHAHFNDSSESKSVDRNFVSTLCKSSPEKGSGVREINTADDSAKNKSSMDNISASVSSGSASIADKSVSHVTETVPSVDRQRFNSFGNHDPATSYKSTTDTLHSNAPENNARSIMKRQHRFANKKFHSHPRLKDSEREIKPAHYRPPMRKIPRGTQPFPAHNQRPTSRDAMKKMCKVPAPVQMIDHLPSPFIPLWPAKFESPRNIIESDAKVWEMKQPKPAHYKKPFGIAGHLIVQSARKNRKRKISDSINSPPPRFHSLPNTPPATIEAPPRAVSVEYHESYTPATPNSSSESENGILYCGSLQTHEQFPTNSSIQSPVRAHWRPEARKPGQMFYETNVLRPNILALEKRSKRASSSSESIIEIVDLTSDIPPPAAEPAVSMATTLSSHTTLTPEERATQQELSQALAKRQKQDQEIADKQLKVVTSPSQVQSPAMSRSQSYPGQGLQFAVPPPPYTGRQRMPVLTQVRRQPSGEYRPIPMDRALVYQPVSPTGGYPAVGPRYSRRDQDFQRQQSYPTTNLATVEPQVHTQAWSPQGEGHPVNVQSRGTGRRVRYPVQQSGHAQFQGHGQVDQPLVVVGSPAGPMVSGQTSRHPAQLSDNHGLRHPVNISPRGLPVVQQMPQGQTQIHQLLQQPRVERQPVPQMVPNQQFVPNGGFIPQTIPSVSTNPQVLQTHPQNPQMLQMAPSGQQPSFQMIQTVNPSMPVMQNRHPSPQMLQIPNGSTQMMQIPQSNPQIMQNRQPSIQNMPNSQPSHRMIHSSMATNFPRMLYSVSNDPSKTSNSAVMQTPVMSQIQTGQGSMSSCPPNLTHEQQLQMRQIRAQHIQTQNVQARNQQHAGIETGSHVPAHQDVVQMQPLRNQAGTRHHVGIEEGHPVMVSPNSVSTVQLEPQRYQLVHVSQSASSSQHNQHQSVLAVDNQAQPVSSQPQQLAGEQYGHFPGPYTQLPTQGQPQGQYMIRPPSQGSIYRQPVNQSAMHLQGKPQTFQVPGSHFPQGVASMQASVVQGHAAYQGQVQQTPSQGPSPQGQAYIVTHSQQGPMNNVKTVQNSQVFFGEGHNIQSRQPVVMSEAASSSNTRPSVSQNNLVFQGPDMQQVNHGHLKSVQNIGQGQRYQLDHAQKSPGQNVWAQQQPLNISSKQQARPVGQNQANLVHQSSPMVVQSAASPVAPVSGPVRQSGVVQSPSQVYSSNSLCQNDQVQQDCNQPQHQPQLAPNAQSHEVQGDGQIVRDQTPVDVKGEELPHLQQVHGSCVLCGKYSLYLCSNCKKIWYCSPECQLSHWQSHASECQGDS